LKIFFDLWVNKIDEKTIDILEKLGYRAIATTDNVSNIDTKGLKIVNKIVISAERRGELLDSLRGVKERFKIVSVKPLSVESARTAAHDTRVDTIIIDDETYEYIDKAQINLMKQFRKPLELPFNKYLALNDSLKAVIYRRLKYYLSIAKQPLIISSYANNWNEVLIPRCIVYYASLLLGLHVKQALLFITSYPREILLRNGVSV